jgi:hypothetical protein
MNTPKILIVVLYGLLSFTAQAQNASSISTYSGPEIKYEPAKSPNAQNSVMTVCDNTVSLSQSVSQTITSGISISCKYNVSGYHAENHYWRAFSLTKDFNVTQIEIGVQQAAASSGSQPITVNVYENTGGNFPAGVRTLKGTASTSVPNQSLTILSVPVAANIASNTQMIIEIFVPDGQTAMNSFLVGTNEDGETGTSYFSAATCNISIVPYSNYNGHPIVMNVIGCEGPGPDIYVDADALGANNGTSWVNAFTDLQVGLDSAKVNDEIWVAAGTYLPSSSPDGTTTNPRDKAFHMSSDMKIYGGFDGTEALLSERDWVANETILSGDIGTPNIDTDNAFHVMITANLTANSLIDGFKITGGNAPGGAGTSHSYQSKTFLFYSGGGLYNIDSDPGINNVIFVSNQAYSGAGMSNEYSDPSITNTVFLLNLGADAGGIYNYYSSPIIKNATFNANSASNYGDSGGAIYNKQSSPIITNTIFWGNHKTGLGAGEDIYNVESNPTVSYCITQENSIYSNEINGILNNRNPLFVDEENGDLRLYQDSPALNSGSNASWTATGLITDIAGNVRPQNGTVDIGAYEGGVQVPIIYVDLDATSGANDGTSWTNAYTDLQQAMDSARLFYHVWVSEGTYMPTSSPDGSTADPRNKSFYLSKNIKVYGGFSGSEAQLSERDWVNNETILSGDIGTPNNNSDNSYHVFITALLTNDAVIDGFTIKDGKTEDSNSSYPFFNGTNFYQRYGAGLYNNDSSPIINNTIFKDNIGDVGTSGGGMYNEQSSPKINNAIFWDNSANNGGGIYNIGNSSKPIITNSTFYANSALNSGGGVYFPTNVSPTIVNSIFWKNTQGGDVNAEGADFSTNNTTSPITYCLIQSNFPYSGKQGIINDQNPLFIDADNGNFELNAGSPAIDMGLNTAWEATGLTSDYSGTLRPQNSIVDIGVYELSAIIYVDKDATAGAIDGTSWGDAFLDFQVAIDAAAEGNQIWVAEGTYLPTKDHTGNASPADARNKNFHLLKDIKIYGGFNGTETQLTERDWQTNPTILSGDIDNNSGDNFNNSYHVLIAANLTNKTILDGFTIIGGNANGGNTTITFGNPSQTFRRDIAGGVYNVRSSPKISNSMLRNNYGDFGGGLYNDLSSAEIDNSVFWQNSASQGAGIFNNGISIPVISNTTIYGNAASNSGGGIFNTASDPVVTNTIFWNNTKGGLNNTAGADFSNSSGTPVITYSLVQAGSSYSGGFGNLNNKFPNFIDAPNGDFKLSKTSSVINKGNNLVVISTKDMANQLRIKLGIVDMGAFEFQGTPYTNAIYVKVNATGNNDGSSWQHAYTDIQTAIDEQTSALDIWVAKGTYLPLMDHLGNTTPNDPRSKTFHLSRDMKIYGGFIGSETLLSQRNWLTNETILSGDFSGNDVINAAGATLSIANNTENAYHVLITANLTNAAVIDGITIKGGKADSSELSISYASRVFEGSYGGGMINRYSASSIANVKFYGNSAKNGGGMYNHESPLEISNTTFSQNFASIEGGGIYNKFSSPTITNSQFSENFAVVQGGGIYIEDSNPEVISSTFSKNKSNYGGAVNNYSSNATFSKCIFTENEAISTNASEALGGGMYNGTASRVTITNSIFSRNSSEDDGGGIFNFNSSHSDIFNSTFSGNSALIGGGISSYSNSDSDVTNSIFWDNLQNGANDVSGADIRGTSTIAYSLTQENSDFSSGTGIINNQNPLFEDAANDLLLLRCFSPAINIGTTTGAPSDDITSYTRVGLPDMGAYEFQESNTNLTLTESMANGTNPTHVGVYSITTEWPILNTNNAVFKAGHFIELKPGFSVAPSGGAATVFRAEIGDGCEYDIE